MRTPNEEFDDFIMDESDEYLLKMAEELKHELSDIKVSDELIAKTLAKVSSQEKTDTSKGALPVVPMERIKAPVKYRSRNFAWIKPLSAAVAACFVLFLGANAMKNGFIGSKKESSNPSYEKKAMEEAVNSGTEMDESTIMKSAATEAPQIVSQQDVNMETTLGIAGAEQYTLQSPQGEEKDTTVMRENSVYYYALEEATNASNDIAQVYGFLDGTNNDQALQLLTLLTSDELQVSTSKPEDEWEYYLVFSLGQEDAVTYQVGKNQFVIATNYHGQDSKNQVVYEMKDLDTFQSSLMKHLE